jgi:hypothetical protein
MNKKNLTKENFWNELYLEYPKNTQIFYDWIDNYKKLINWNLIFSPLLKFHDLPYSMQLGIWIEFLIDTKNYELINIENFNLQENIINFVSKETKFIKKRFSIENDEYNLYLVYDDKKLKVASSYIKLQSLVNKLNNTENSKRINIEHINEIEIWICWGCHEKNEKCEYVREI